MGLRSVLMIKMAPIRCATFPFGQKIKRRSDYYHYGVELFGEGDENAAEIYFLKAIDCDPVFEEAYESLGVLYGRQERYEEAIEYMQKLSKLNPKSVMAHTNMSLYYMRVGEIEKAEEQKSQATVKQFQQLGDEAEAKKKAQEAEKHKKRRALQARRHVQGGVGD